MGDYCNQTNLVVLVRIEEGDLVVPPLEIIQINHLA